MAIDYSKFVNVQNPFLGAMTGFERGVGMGQRSRALGMQEAQLGMQAAAQRQKALAQAQAQGRAAQMRQDLQDYYANPDPTAAQSSQLLAKYPEMVDKLTKGMEFSTKGRMKERATKELPLYSALERKDYKTAESMLNEKLEAAENIGSKSDAAQVKGALEILKRDPNALKKSMTLTLTHALGEEKFVETLGKIGKEERAEELHAPTVSKAVTDAALSRGLAPMKLAEKKFDVEHLEDEFNLKKMRTQASIMMAKAQMAQAGVQRDILMQKAQDMSYKYNKELRNRAAEGETLAFKANDTLALVKDIMSPSNRQALKNLTGARGIVSGFVPGSKELDLKEKLDQLDSRTTLGFLSSFKGSTSEKEMTVASRAGSRIKNRRQSYKSYVDALNNLKNSFSRIKKGVKSQYGLPKEVSEKTTDQTVKPVTEMKKQEIIQSADSIVGFGG